MTGHLHLTVTHDPATQRSHVSQQSFCAPMHVGKGYWHENAVLVHAVNSTAGLFAGDAVEWKVNVEPGARLRLMSPSASRVHRAARDETQLSLLEPAHSAQTFRVGAGGWLEVWPELFIPHAGCRYRQTTRIEIEPGGELLFCESLAPGRVAFGEAFAWESLQWALDIHHGHEHVARERWLMTPDPPSHSTAGWKGLPTLPVAYYAALFFLTSRINEQADCWQRIHDLQSEDRSVSAVPLHIGVSRLPAAGWSIKLLARDGAVLRRALGRIRGLLLNALEPAPTGR